VTGVDDNARIAAYADILRNGYVRRIRKTRRIAMAARIGTAGVGTATAGTARRGSAANIGGVSIAFGMTVTIMTGPLLTFSANAGVRISAGDGRGTM